MMRGRMVHDRDGHTALQRYGVDDSEVIWSVSRGALNMLLLDAAEAAGVRCYFGQSLVGADFARRSEEHTSELQSLMRISYAVFCFEKKIPIEIRLVSVVSRTISRL